MDGGGVGERTSWGPEFHYDNEAVVHLINFSLLSSFSGREARGDRAQQRSQGRSVPVGHEAPPTSNSGSRMYQRAGQSLLRSPLQAEALNSPPLSGPVLHRAGGTTVGSHIPVPSSPICLQHINPV